MTETLDWATAPAHFRDAHARLQRRNVELETRNIDNRNLRLEVAALRARLDPDMPDVEMALRTFDSDDITPESVHAHYLNIASAVLSNYRAGRSYREVAEELEPTDDGPDEATMAALATQQRTREALYGVEP